MAPLREVRGEEKGMQAEEIQSRLSSRLGTNWADPVTVLSAVMQALSETAPQETQDLRAQLPAGLLSEPASGEQSRRSWPEFAERVGDLAGACDQRQAREYVQVGFSVLGDAVTDGQLRQLMEALPDDYEQLAPAVTGTTGDVQTLLADLADEAELDTHEQARELLRAVLRAVARGVSGGQTSLLTSALPTELSDELTADEHAAPVTFEQFAKWVAEDSSATSDEAVRDHIAAVLTVLRQWVPRELLDTVGQLPNELAELVR